MQIIYFSFERIRENNKPKDHRGSFSNYYVPKVEIKDFNVLIDEKRFFDLPVKEAYKKNNEMCRNNDYVSGNLLGFSCF